MLSGSCIIVDFFFLLQARVFCASSVGHVINKAFDAKGAKDAKENPTDAAEPLRGRAQFLCVLGV